MHFSIKASLLNFWERRIHPAEITVENGRIASVKEIHPDEILTNGVIMPGFIDAHVHIESSMLIPSEFARLAVIHGTVATVSDPHEIANVCGIEGVRYMIDNGNKVPFKFHFGAPSCVPATSFETAGAAIDADQVRDLLQLNEIFYLSEMMNFPGVLNSDPGVLKKISAAHSCNKPVDGHAPGLRGADAKKYIDAGITTDHECFTKEEALDKLKYGMKIIIREGSAAKNFEALIGLLSQYPEQIMFCSDDKHPDSLVEGHINVLCARAVKKGLDIFKIIQAACVNPALHYGMQSGILRVGDPADFIIVRDLVNFNVLKTFINGEIVSEGGKTLLDSIQVEAINNFNCTEKTVADFKIPVNHGQSVFPVIEALDGQLITNQLLLPLHVENGFYVSNVHSDVLKIAVINRYSNAPVAISFIKNFGLKRGAIASSVAHDSHNIVAVGVDDESICRAVNCVIRQRGGISCIDREKEYVVSLPVGGLMSTEDGFSVAKAYTAIDAKAKELGSELSAPFMTLSFMALLVIPRLKLSDKGLFDVDKFALLESYGKQKAG